jgi:hypothetical protein
MESRDRFLGGGRPEVDVNGTSSSASMLTAQALQPARIGLAWLTAVGVDLFFNAGVFTPLFDRTREPALLPDDALARRIVVAFALLAIAVAALAWLLDAVGARGTRAVRIGAMAGLIVGSVALGATWTALDMSGLFVVAGAVVTTAEGAASAAVLTSRRSGSSLRIRVAVAFVLLAGAGQIFANLVR